MTRRPGLSVTEVLVALFILALGVIAIQTMFPLAASQLLVAVREDRSALAAVTGDATFRSYWRTEVAEANGGNEPFFAYLDNPNIPGLPPARSTEHSYPVIVDPMGYVARSGPDRDRFGDGGVTLIRRAPVNALLPATDPRHNRATAGNPAAYALRMCSLMDGMGYDEFGRAFDPGGNPSADREFRYNWFWIVQRTNNANKTAANLTVVVFDKRAHLHAPPRSEEVFAATFSPDLRAGNWVMDATVAQEPAGNWVRHAHLYRVARVEPQGANTLVDLETPVRRLDGSPNPYTGTLVIVRGVSGVYARTPLAAQ
jgi:hypothetical protein